MLAVVAILAAQTATIATAQPAAACPSVEVVFARGTLEPPGVGATGQSFIDALNTRLATPVAVRPVNYPAPWTSRPL